MNNFTYYIEYFTCQRIQEIYQELKKQNLETLELENYLTVNEDKFNKLFNSFSEEDKQFASDYIDRKLIVEANLNEGIYQQGYKDCVRLLKLMGVLG